jgi:hypothetical protein
MLIDSTGLGYSARRGEILVHYPTGASGESVRQDDAPEADRQYTAGWPIGPIPESYILDPPNAITAERVKLWTTLLASDSSHSAE